MQEIPVHIRKPIWSKKAVGINHEKCKGEALLRITIGVSDKDGNQLYPYEYLIPTYRAINYPVQSIGSVHLHIIPIADLTIKEN